MTSTSLHAGGEVRARILFRPVIGNGVSHEPCLTEVVTFCYRIDDPYAVRMLIPDGGRVWEWHVARDLLEAGRRGPAGQGSLQVYPARFDGPDVVVLAFYSDQQWCRFGVSHRALARFLGRSYRLVPAGTETSRLDVDAGLAAAFGGSR